MKIRIIFLDARRACLHCRAGPKVTLAGGKMAAIKGIDTFNLVFDYSKMTVGDLGREANYVKRNARTPKKVAWFRQCLGRRLV